MLSFMRASLKHFRGYRAFPIARAVSSALTAGCNEDISSDPDTSNYIAFRQSVSKTRLNPCRVQSHSWKNATTGARADNHRYRHFSRQVETKTIQTLEPRRFPLGPHPARAALR